MPVVESSYVAPFGLRGGHSATVLPTLFGKSPKLSYRRKRLELEDGDFLDLDQLLGGHERVVIISHGLEASSVAPYVRATAAEFQSAGYDVIAWNCRGCSGEPNRLLRSYHSGVSEDLLAVAEEAVRQSYKEIYLIGFSLGGNITLKLLGELGSANSFPISGGVAFSVPCDLRSSSRALARRSTRIYMRRFLRSLEKKVKERQKTFAEFPKNEELRKCRSFLDFDEQYTAPLNGFVSAEDYWRRASSKPLLEKIRVPTLLVSAKNDPFLGPECFPFGIAKESEFFQLEAPETGGHVTFPQTAKGYWPAQRALEFFRSKCFEVRG